VEFRYASRPSSEWSDDDYDVLADGVVVGRIMKAAAAPEAFAVVMDARRQSASQSCPSLSLRCVRFRCHRTRG
jgi:hypothetical protein